MYCKKYLSATYHWIRKFPMYLINYLQHRVLSPFICTSSIAGNVRSFTQDGYLKLEKFSDKKQIDEDFDFVLKDAHNQININSDRLYRLWGAKSDFLSFSLDAKDEILFKYVYQNSDLMLLLSDYYGRDFYLRNNPTIEITDTSLSHETQLFHVDFGLNQINLFLNLCDIDEDTYHTEYLKGSNNKFYFPTQDRFSWTFKARVKKFLDHNPNHVVSTTGEKGTAYLMDVGNGMHRGVPGGLRVILGLNFVSNFAHTGWRNSWNPDDQAQKYFFSKPDRSFLNRVSTLKLPKTFFNMVFQNVKPSIFLPTIYSKNYLNIKSGAI